jgi:2-polyprenyl-3-methyl-5-hydroxy-6-metoxy-1,4-benzoquinol methylase
VSEPRDAARALEQSWSTNADSWVAAVRGGSIESRRVATDRAVVEAVLARRPQRVLDVGCGEGWLVRALAEHGINCEGLDGSPVLVDAARAAGTGTFHLCSYADLAADPHQVGTGFDVVVANFALLDADLVLLLQALRSLLVERGSLIIQTVHPWTAGGRYEDGWRLEEFRAFGGQWHPMPWFFRTLESWARVLREAGYALADLREPEHPRTQAPLSLLLIGEPRSEGEPHAGLAGQPREK